jgi:hypothetical protein
LEKGRARVVYGESIIKTDKRILNDDFGKTIRSKNDSQQKERVIEQGTVVKLSARAVATIRNATGG